MTVGGQNWLLIVLHLNIENDMVAEEKVHFLWVGSHLSLLEKLSLNSFLFHGYSCWLWVYDMHLAKEVSVGVVIKNARSIIPEKAVFQYIYGNEFGHGKGSYVGFSDIFRCKVLYEYECWWSDLDVTCLQPLPSECPCFFRTHDVLPVVGNLIKVPKRLALMKACYERVNRLVHTENWGWLLPLKISNNEIDRLDLEWFIQETTNPDRWAYIDYYRRF